MGIHTKNVELIKITSDAVDVIEKAGRICYKSKPNEKYIKGTLTRNLIKSGHLSVLEHASATFLITGVSRAFSHQLVRHRLCSYSQQSQRYVKEGQFDFVIPPPIIDMGEPAVAVFKDQMKQIQEMYNHWKSSGLKNEDARFVLPNACCTEIVMTSNFRELRHIAEVRCDKHAQWEIRDVCGQMLGILRSMCPIVFGDLAEKYLDLDADCIEFENC